uniref:Uncharacterized protein n=1 Tax=Aureoumbra lagunensis TaxID=44058 RepID=A0A7S3JTT8_9STRA
MVSMEKEKKLTENSSRSFRLEDCSARTSSSSKRKESESSSATDLDFSACGLGRCERSIGSLRESLSGNSSSISEIISPSSNCGDGIEVCCRSSSSSKSSSSYPLSSSPVLLPGIGC